jgi:hypothetical protein
MIAFFQTLSNSILRKAYVEDVGWWGHEIQQEKVCPKNGLT